VAEEKPDVDLVDKLPDLAGNGLEERRDVIGGGDDGRSDAIGGEDEGGDAIGGDDGPQPSQKADLPLAVSAIEDKVKIEAQVTFSESGGDSST
jgi:hypothetical protein